MKNVYKKPLTLEQQVNYLEDNKKITYNTISKENAKRILYQHCYINVITPFKHIFARTDPLTGSPARDTFNNHIYDKSTDFNEYYSIYQKERSSYGYIYI